MCNAKIFAVGNATGRDAKLTSPYYPEDNRSIPDGYVTHTGNDFIRVPDCSGAQWYSDHHILIQAVNKSWTVSFWANDEKDCLLYWAMADAWPAVQPLPNSNSGENGSLMITLDRGRPSVGWAPW